MVTKSHQTGVWTTAIGAAVCLSLTLTACGKVAEPTKEERAESKEKAKQSAVFGDQVKALNKAQTTADEAAKAAAEKMKKADQ
jgi:hypothetical protein